MSLFDKMKKHQPPEKPNDGEFKSDVNTILHGTSVQNRKEMCELEYMKARRLLKNPTVETVARAKNIMNTLATDFDYLPAVLWMAEFSVNGVKNPEQAAMWYKKSRRPWQCEWSVQNCRYSYGRQRCYPQSETCNGVL